MKLAVVGAGAWGTALAKLLTESGHAVTLWGHDATHLDAVRATRRNERYLPGMLDGRFSGTMCLSEPHAGSDVGAARTKAVHLDGNRYKITGTKCWISGGDAVSSAPPGNRIHTQITRTIQAY